MAAKHRKKDKQNNYIYNSRFFNTLTSIRVVAHSKCIYLKTNKKPPSVTKQNQIFHKSASQTRHPLSNTPVSKVKTLKTIDENGGQGRQRDHWLRRTSSNKCLLYYTAFFCLYTVFSATSVTQPAPDEIESDHDRSSCRHFRRLTVIDASSIILGEDIY